MLENIHIKNVALIEDENIGFSEGLNILSGETGAGKSMIISSINFALGERPGKDFLRAGANSAQVEALFFNRSSAVSRLMMENGISVDEEGAVLVVRTLNPAGKSVCKVNGTTVTLGMLRQISENLIDVHGQHEHQSLLNSKKHIALLDKFCGSGLETLLDELGAYYKKYKDASASIKKLAGGEDLKQRLEILEFQAAELEAASLSEGEEERLFERRKIILNSEKINRLTAESIELLYDGSESAADKASAALNNVSELSGMIGGLEDIAESLQTAYTLIEDAARELHAFASGEESTGAELAEIEERLSLIYGLKRKYGGSEGEILARYGEIKRELELAADSEESLKRLEAERAEAVTSMKKICADISSVRRQKAAEIENIVEAQLKDLQMKSAKFKIKVEKKKEITPLGWDSVEFLISANMGEELKPLAKIASGGEISRVMLALKTVLASADDIETFIFDEIDTGVSGITAGRVAEKMAAIARNHQIICITHLPQIAAMGDAHFVIEKDVSGGKTVTGVRRLDEPGIESELARLMGGEATKTLYDAAKEIKDRAEKLKSKL